MSFCYPNTEISSITIYIYKKKLQKIINKTLLKLTILLPKINYEL